MGDFSEFCMHSGLLLLQKKIPQRLISVRPMFVPLKGLELLK
jgi:hypothetical protein